MHDLREKVALVTGTTSGIGKEIARRLAAHGCAIMVNGIDGRDVASAVCDELREVGAVAVGSDEVNLLDQDACARLVAATVDQLGSVDILVNNAGIQHVAPIEAFPDDEWNRIVDLNLSVPFRLIRHCLPVMRAGGWGRIINIASVHGLVASVSKSAYVAAKHGLVGLTKTVGLETAAEPITCNAICPGYVQTALIDNQIEALAEAKKVGRDDAAGMFLAEKQPSGKFVPPADIGAMIVFLCSDAGAHITGSALPIDGGWTAQ